jgi:hypothetical protein
MKPDSSSIKLQSFFASRACLCVYVAVGKQSFRVQFVDEASQGVVVNGNHAGAEEARRIAKRALEEHAEALRPLFRKVAQATT